MDLVSPFLIVVMITSPPNTFKWRRMIRKPLRELTRGVKVAGRSASLSVRFAVGKLDVATVPRLRPRIQALLAAEQDAHGDLAFLNMTDGSCNDGKTWYTFEWALRHFPDADVIFKQDDDTIVDWRLALPRMLDRVVPEAALRPLRRLYVGTLAANYSCPSVRDGRAPCAAGALYGFSGDIAKWVVDNAVIRKGQWEDMESCLWARRFEAQHKQRFLAGPGSSPREPVPAFSWRLDPRGLLEALTGQIGGACGFYSQSGRFTPVALPGAKTAAWVHPVKQEELYLQCVEDREKGCRVPMFPNSDYPALLHFRLPPAASDF